MYGRKMSKKNKILRDIFSSKQARQLPTKASADHSRQGNKKISILGIGNPLMDIIAHVEYSFLEKFDVIPHTMNLIAENDFKKIFKQIKNYTFMPGGSCTNTLRGFAFLAAHDRLLPPFFIGAVGKDDIGLQYMQAIEKIGIKNHFIEKNGPTGSSIILVTPDSERTMLTCLGASRKITDTDLDFSLVSQAEILHLTGYEWDTENQKKIAKKLVAEANKNSVPVSFDLADPFVVKRYKNDFLSWIPQHVSILFGNREEYSLLMDSGVSDENMIVTLKYMADVLIMKVGKEGAYCYSQNKFFHCKGFPANAIDTTGAGDAFAGAFMYALLKKQSLPKCLKAANRLASLIVTSIGCDYSQIRKAEIKNII
jgi:sugar/nucleoside kinase (ribokinase family)